MDKVLGYIESGKQEGANLVYGGNRVQLSGNDCTQGYYIQPAIFTDVKPQQKIAREEIFGPVLSVFTFSDESEAIALANNTRFGLAAYLATDNQGRSLRLASALNAGLIVVTGTSTPGAGGIDLGIEPHKESGFGTEGGLSGLAAYTVRSSVYLFS